MKYYYQLHVCVYVHFDPQECLQRNLEMLPELHQGKISDVIYRASPPKRLTEAVGKKHHLEADDKKTEAESSFPGEQIFCKNEADIKQVSNMVTLSAISKLFIFP